MLTKDGPDRIDSNDALPAPPPAPAVDGSSSGRTGVPPPPPVCNNNGTCDAGEDNTNCPADCPAPVAIPYPFPPCDRDGVCDPGEESTHCPSDCSICNNDGTCQPLWGENVTNCPSDCTPRPTGPCMDPARSTWASPTGDDGTGDGTLERPYRSPFQANRRALDSIPHKDVCLLEGIYETDMIIPNTNFFGSFYQTPGGLLQRRNIEEEGGRTSVIRMIGRNPAFSLNCNTCGTMIIEGFRIEQGGPSSGSNTYPLVMIEDTPAIFRHNTVERGLGDGGAFATSGVNRVAVELKANRESANPMLIGNTIRVLENSAPSGSTVGVMITNVSRDATKSMVAYLRGNVIDVRRSPRATVGVLGYSTAREAPLILIMEKNTVLFNSAIQREVAEVTDDPSEGDDSGLGVSCEDCGYRGAQSGGESAGVLLGMKISDDLRRNFIPQFFTRAGIRDNKIFGKIDEISNGSSTAIRLERGEPGNATNVFNNWLQGGKGKKYSSGIYSVATKLNLSFNTISAGGVSLPRMRREAPTDARSCALTLAFGSHTPLDLYGNILTSQEGWVGSDKVGLCMIGAVPTISFQYNLFDSPLNYAFYDPPSRGRAREWNFTQFKTSYRNPGSSEVVPSNNLSGAAGLRNLSSMFFDLTEGSPAIDNAECSPSGFTIDQDFEGDPRPTGRRCDIGADEFVRR